MANFRGWEWLILLVLFSLLIALPALAIFATVRAAGRRRTEGVEMANGKFPSAGWLADPSAPGNMRYWDGRGWTEYRKADSE